jgi:hypothetical protein
LEPAVLACPATLAVLVVASAPAAAQDASCRGYPDSVRLVVMRGVEALRLVEREAADRMVGLDTRPFDFLVGQARAAAEVIADQNALAAEEGLKRCRNHVRPLRATCRGAALALARAIEEQATGAASKPSKQAYVEAVATCERWLGLTPLKTVFRAID